MMDGQPAMHQFSRLDTKSNVTSCATAPPMRRGDVTLPRERENTRRNEEEAISANDTRNEIALKLVAREKGRGCKTEKRTGFPRNGTDYRVGLHDTSRSR